MVNDTSRRTPSALQAWVPSLLWAVVRIWVGVEFLQASLEKIGSSVWTGTQAGVAVRGFLGYASSPQATGGPHPEVLRPYAWVSTHLLISHAATLSYLVTAGEFIVGVTLILGLGTRAAALGGAGLNLVYMLSGSAGLNVPMFTIELSILLVGVSAGQIGLDRVVLLRTPSLHSWWPGPARDLRRQLAE